MPEEREEIASWTITLRIQAPFLTKSSAPGDYGIDAVVARRADRQPYIPGTLITGKLLEAWKQLGTVKDRCGGILFAPETKAWLGKWLGDDAASGFEPRRKRLTFTDFVFISKEPSERAAKTVMPTAKAGSKEESSKCKRETKTRFRIRMDAERGAADEGALQLIESPFASGKIVEFEGTACFLAKSREEIQRLEWALEIGLKWIGQLGAQRTIGFGRLVGVRLQSYRTAFEDRELQAETTAACYPLLLQLQDPFCVTEGGPDANLFRSTQVIPGGVIKGALASQWCALCGREGVTVDAGLDPQRSELSKYFSRLRLTHAFPRKTDARRPVRPPLSLVKARKSLYDLALCEQPVLVLARDKNKEPGFEAPAFAVDWKDKDHANVWEDFGWPEVPQELRVRTAIDANTRRAAEAQLFACELVVPHDNLVWHAYVDLSAIDEAQRATAASQLDSLLRQWRGRLHGLGKTKARAKVKLMPAGNPDPKFPSHPRLCGGLWILTLQTPALLCDPDQLDETSGQEELRGAYEETWKQLSGNFLKLEHYFAHQRLSGGTYLHGRFGQTKDHYRPYLFTEAGSVFVLKAVPGCEVQAAQKIREWLSHGLPLPGWAVGRYMRNAQAEDRWRYCPFLPENGYGEIAVNLEIHWQKQPQEGEYQYIPMPGKTNS